LTEIEALPLEELPDGSMRLIPADAVTTIGLYRCQGKLHAIEDRCTHDNGILFEGTIDLGKCTVECPRHGSLFDLRTGRPLNLPAYVPVDTFAVNVDGDMIRVEVD
jgi:3-phenylpropionate/trans-cinnamate dioxygenase ferredoxin subunit